MKKIILILLITAFVFCGALISSANYQDLPDKIDDIIDVWIGSSTRVTSNITGSATPSLAEQNALPESAGRIGSSKASEYYSLEDSASGGFFYKNSSLPQRLHLEFDYYNENELYGDFRYSYLDYVLIRFLPRRFYHNLDNITIYDFASGTGGSPLLEETSEIEINDRLEDEYGLRIDIDYFIFRLKMPNFPLHIYNESEIITQKGTKQSRFLGGDGYYSNLVRVSDKLEVDQQSKEVTFGSNAHLGFIEMDISQRVRKFESDIINSTYDYASSGLSIHNVIPELEATTNTLKIHTSHSGRVSAAATISEITKTNEYSNAEAKNTLGYGEIFWLPMSYLSFTTKVRHMKNEASSPTSVTATNWLGSLTSYTVEPGVESETNSAIFNIRYSLIPKTNINLKYSKKVKTLDDQSALEWNTPEKSTTDEYELKLTNWLIPNLRATAKLNHTAISTELDRNDIYNNPDQTDKFNFGLTWSITPGIVAFASSYIALEETDSNSISDGFSEADFAEALRQQHLFSISFLLNEKISITPAYTYISDEEHRDIVWGDSIDSEYTNEQIAHNYSLGMMYLPNSRISVNLSIDYTTTRGTYEPTSLFEDTSTIINAEEIAYFSKTETEEVNVRFDYDFDIGSGWGLGIDLRYTDWQDNSIDNPSEDEYLGGLLKLTKVM